MLKKSLPNIYAHLKNAGRMEGRVLTRCQPEYISPGAQACLRRLHAGPGWVNINLMTTVLTALAGEAQGSGTKRTSGKSGRKAA